MNPFLSTPNLAFLGGIGAPELIIVFLIVLVLFGAGKIPKIAKDLGSGIKEFKRSMDGNESHERSYEVAKEEAKVEAKEEPQEEIKKIEIKKEPKKTTTNKTVKVAKKEVVKKGRRA